MLTRGIPLPPTSIFKGRQLMTGIDPATPGHRGDENDEDLGMDLVDQVSTHADRPARRPLRRSSSSASSPAWLT
jgi:hypothetical protein